MLRAAVATGRDVDVARAHFALGAIARTTHDDTRAMAHIHAGVRHARISGSRIWLAWTLQLFGEMPHLVGIQAAEAASEEALALFRDRHNEWGQANMLQTLAMYAMDRGDVARASRLLMESLTLREAIGERFGCVEGLACVADLAVCGRRYESAARLLAAADAWAAELGYVYGGKDFHLERTIALTHDRLGGELLADQRAAGAALPRVAALAEAHAMLAALATDAERGPIDTAGATALRETNGARNGAWGGRDAPRSLESMVAAPGKTGSPAMMLTSAGHAPTAAPRIELTGREHEVLGLLVLRLTDREIADHLYIGHRTASNHVGNILAKLGASNRREAAALALRFDLI